MKRAFAALVILLALCGGAAAQCAGGISGCPAASSVALTDLTVISQPLSTSPTGFATRKATVAQLSAPILANPNTWTGLQTFSGGAIVPTRSPGDNTTNAASTAFVTAALVGLSGTVTSVQIAAGSGITVTGACTITISGVCTVAVSAGFTLPFTSITGQATLAQLPTLGTNTVLGSIAGGTPIALSTTQFTTLCNAFTSVLSGCAPSSGGGATNFLRADGTWAVPAGAGSVNASTANNLGYYATSGSTISGLASANNALIATNGTGVPSASNAPILGGGPFTINPTANSTNQALVINQSSPTSGSTSSQLTWNLISINDQYNSTAPGLQYGFSISSIAAFRINYTIGGTNLGVSQHIANLSVIARTVPGSSNGSDAVSMGAVAYSNQVYTGLGGLVGANGFTYVDTGGSEFYAVGAESDVGIATGASSVHRYAMNLRNLGVGQGSTGDGVFLITSQGMASGAFQNLFLLSNLSGSQPMSSTADFFRADTAYTVGNIFNLPTMTVTNNILNFPNAVMTGSGGLMMGSQASGRFLSIPAGNLVQASVASGGNVSLLSNANTTSGADGVFAGTSLNTNFIEMLAIEPNNTAAVFGQTSGNWSAMVASGASNNGMLLGTNSTGLVLFGTNGVAAGSINPSQQWTMGPNFAPAAGVKLTINNNTVQIPTGGLTGMTVQIGSANNALNRIAMFAAASAGGINILDFVSSRGTFAAPSATGNGDTMGAFGAFGYGATGYGVSSGAGILFTAAEAWTDTAQGARFAFTTTPTGTITQAIALTVNASGAIWVGTTNVDEGQNNLGVQGQMFMPNITTSSAAATGSVCWTTATGKFTVDTTLACLSSVMAVKDKIEHIDPAYALSVASRLDAVSYVPRGEHVLQGSAVRQPGLIAEQVATVDEMLVAREDGVLRGVRYQQSVAFAFAAIRQLKADNDNMAAEIARLRQQIGAR